MRHIHPFPARMAPELAMAAMEGIPSGANVLDPMAGSGTVLRHAAFAGHRAFGFDLDPLAVLISKVCSRRVDLDEVESLHEELQQEFLHLRLRDCTLPWMDGDEETTTFVSYWFGRKQRGDLRKLSHLVHQAELIATPNELRYVDVLKLALSRIIVTKENGASLARDVSHSRPHRVRNKSDFDVADGFRKSVQQVLRFLEDGMPAVDALVRYGDARQLGAVRDASIDLVVTSPPYLNAIDYLRGHKLSLVWLGFTIEQIRNIRAASIGSERAEATCEDGVAIKIQRAMVGDNKLPRRFQRMVHRYAKDVYRMMGEIARVLKKDGKAVLVVGDSCLKSEFISNSGGIIRAARSHGLRLASRATRDLPPNSRYLPISTGTPLENRMRMENVLTFAHS